MKQWDGMILRHLRPTYVIPLFLLETEGHYYGSCTLLTEKQRFVEKRRIPLLTLRGV